MTLGATYNEVTVSPMNTGENELQTAEIRRIQGVKHAGRRCGSILTTRSSWNFMAQLSPLMRDWSRKRELDEALGLTATAGDMFRDPRYGKNTPTIGGCRWVTPESPTRSIPTSWNTSVARHSTSH